MISDEERREVAKRLRRELDYMRERRAWYRSNVDAVECGNTAYRNIAASAIPYGNIGSDYIGVVEHLADLIDRPTCHNASGHQDMSAQKPKARKRAIYLMTDFGGDWEDAWERPVIAFTDKARAEECAAKRETRQYDEYGPVWDYEGSEVKEIPLVDFGDEEEEK